MEMEDSASYNSEEESEEEDNDQMIVSDSDE